MARTVFALALGLVVGCLKPDSIALGEQCNQRPECKAPATECLTILNQKVCTLQCSKKDKCPEDFECLAMEVAVVQDGKGAGGGKGGYCLKKGLAPPNAARL